MALRYNTHTHTYTHTYTHTTNRVCARANARFEFNAVQIVQTRRRRASEGGGERIEFFSFCHHHPFDPAFADILSLPPSLPLEKRESASRSAGLAIERDGCATLDGQRGKRVECGEREGKKKKYVADVTRACGSARLGSARLARLEIFKALFGYPLSRKGDEGGREGGMSVFASPC